MPDEHKKSKKKSNKPKINRKREKEYIMRAVHRAGGYSRDDLIDKPKEELYKLRIAALKRMLGQFEQLQTENDGELPKKELGYKVYYEEELELLESGEETAWLTKCMGVVLPTREIEQFHVKTPKERRKVRREAQIQFLRDEKKDLDTNRRKFSAVAVNDAKKRKTKEGDADDFKKEPAKKAKTDADDADFA